MTTFHYSIPITVKSNKPLEEIDIRLTDEVITTLFEDIYVEPMEHSGNQAMVCLATVKKDKTSGEKPISLGKVTHIGIKEE